MNSFKFYFNNQLGSFSDFPHGTTSLSVKKNYQAVKVVFKILSEKTFF